MESLIDLKTDFVCSTKMFANVRTVAQYALASTVIHNGLTDSFENCVSAVWKQYFPHFCYQIVLLTGSCPCHFQQIHVTEVFILQLVTTAQKGWENRKLSSAVVVLMSLNEDC